LGSRCIPEEAVSTWSLAGKSFKDLGEVDVVGKSALARDVIDGLAGILQKLAGQVDAHVTDIGTGLDARMMLGCLLFTNGKGGRRLRAWSSRPARASIHIPDGKAFALRIPGTFDFLGRGGCFPPP